MCNALDCSVKEDVPLNEKIDTLILCNKFLLLNVFLCHIL